MSVLAKIVERKRERLSLVKSGTALAELKSRIRDLQGPMNFSGAIKRNGSSLRLIAEVKKASPSKGLIRKDFDHKAISSIYREKNVDAISVLTEEDFFQGKLEFLADVKKIAGLPVLRKDFLFDEYQVYEARAHLADAILLIATMLETTQAEELVHLAHELGMAVLFEVHNLKELELALVVNAPIIGINNRDLETLAIDLNTTFELKKEIPPEKITVSESGIRTRRDVLMLQNAGVDAMLVGTSFMEAGDIAQQIDELRGTA